MPRKTKKEKVSFISFKCVCVCVSAYSCMSVKSSFNTKPWPYNLVVLNVEVVGEIEDPK